jgi:hypothetical protein
MFKTFKSGGGSVFLLLVHKIPCVISGIFVYSVVCMCSGGPRWSVGYVIVNYCILIQKVVACLKRRSVEEWVWVEGGGRTKLFAEERFRARSEDAFYTVQAATDDWIHGPLYPNYGGVARREKKKKRKLSQFRSWTVHAKNTKETEGRIGSRLIFTSSFSTPSLRIKAGLRQKPRSDDDASI